MVTEISVGRSLPLSSSLSSSFENLLHTRRHSHTKPKLTTNNHPAVALLLLAASLPSFALFTRSIPSRKETTNK